MVKLNVEIGNVFTGHSEAVYCLEKGKNNQLKIREVELNFHQDWPRQHWQSIRSAYGNAPFFPYYADELAPLFTDPPALLWDFNLSFLKIISEAPFAPITAISAVGHA